MKTSPKIDDDVEVRLTEVVEAVKKKAEGQILGAYFTSVFEMSPLVDKLATWLLAGIGGTAGLTITNIESISNILSFSQIKIGLGILTISALFGFMEKLLALDIQSTTAQETKLREVLEKSSREFKRRIGELEPVAAAQNIDINSRIDTKKCVERFAKAHPWYKRMQFSRNRTPDEAQTARLRRFYRQVTYAVLEFLGFLAFILVVIASI